jgi:hypothetical protein
MDFHRHFFYFGSRDPGSVVIAEDYNNLSMCFEMKKIGIAHTIFLWKDRREQSMLHLFIGIAFHVLSNSQDDIFLLMNKKLPLFMHRLLCF